MRDLVHRRSTKNRNDFYLYLFLLFYGAVIVYLAHKLPIWEDEAYSLNTSSHDLATVINQSYHFEGQPSGYFLLLALWRKIDSGIFFARMFSVLFIGLSGIYFYRIVRLSEGPKFSQWMLIIFLLNPFTVWAALEIRLYAFVIFLSTGLIYFFLQFYIEEQKKYLYIFLVLSLIGIYTQYFLAIEIIAVALSIWILKGWKPFFRFCLYLIPVGILFIPNLLFINHQIEIAQRDVFNGNNLEEIWTIMRSPQNLLLNVGILDVTVSRIIRIAFVLIISYAIWLLYMQYDQKAEYYKYIQYLFITLFISILLLCIIVSVTRIGFQKKYMAFLFPLLLLIFSLLKGYNLRRRNLIFGIISVYFILLLFINYETPLKSYDYSKAANYVSDIQKEEEPVLLYTKILLPAFTYYYKGGNPLISLPKSSYDNKYYEENLIDTSGLKKAIQSISSPTNSFILITGQIIGFKYPINLNNELIDLYIKNNFDISADTSIIGDKLIHTLRIRRLEIK